tara:strand:- start:1633 stop:1872 length:240 start_codon:yes stop_codon:yes gene_type:complete
MTDKSTIRDLAEKIAQDFALSIKERTDELLRIDCDQYTKLGSDSTKSEITKVKLNSKFIYKQLKTVDNEIGTMLLKALD